MKKYLSIFFIILSFSSFGQGYLHRNGQNIEGQKVPNTIFKSPGYSVGLDIHTASGVAKSLRRDVLVSKVINVGIVIVVQLVFGLIDASMTT